MFPWLDLMPAWAQAIFAFGLAVFVTAIFFTIYAFITNQLED